MLYCIRFPLQQATPDWLMWAPEHTIFQLLDCRAKLDTGETSQASTLASILGSGWVFHTTRVRLDSSAMSACECSQNFSMMVCCTQDGEFQDTHCHFLISGSQHYQNIFPHNIDCT